MIEDKYNAAVAAVRSFEKSVSAESQAITAKILAYARRLEGLDRHRSQREAQIFNEVMRDTAIDLEAFAGAIDKLVVGHDRNLELLTEGFTGKIKSLDLSTEAGRREREAYGREARSLAGTAASNKGKVSGLYENIKTMRDSNWDTRLTAACNKVLASVDQLFKEYEDLETFALRIGFVTEPPDTQEAR